MTKRREPIDYIADPLRRLINSEASIGILLFLAAIAALVVSNSSWGGEWYAEIWSREIGIQSGDWSFTMDLHHIINDGLMAIFFFLVGLEIKREFLFGELSTFKKASLPIAAALGGMVFPAAIFLILTSGEAAKGWGIPMATDIAFVLGLINLVRNRIARSLKIFVTSLAVVDDIGAVLVIAFFYTSDLHPDQLLIAGGALALLIVANRLGIRSVTFYSMVGIVGIWTAFFYSGIHPTIAGILIAFTIPARYQIDKKEYAQRVREAFNKLFNARSVNHKINTDVEEEMLYEIEEASDEARSPLQKIERGIHPYVYFLIMPVFAFANAGVNIESNFLELLMQPVSLGVICGLILGKTLGISFTSRFVVWIGAASLPKGANWSQVYGASMLAGIGFTMSLFISELAYSQEILVEEAKMAILVGSFISAAAGLLYLRFNKNVVHHD
jgi:NhaA family Na+:H+ antiporter